MNTNIQIYTQIMNNLPPNSFKKSQIQRKVKYEKEVQTIDNYYLQDE